MRKVSKNGINSFSEDVVLVRLGKELMLQAAVMTSGEIDVGYSPLSSAEAFSFKGLTSTPVSARQRLVKANVAILLHSFASCGAPLFVFFPSSP